MFAKLPFVIVLAVTASAHFSLDFPIARGDDHPQQVHFCDGLPTNATGRHEFPLSGPAPVVITAEHVPWQLALFVSNMPDPKDFSSFMTAGTTNYLLNFTAGTTTGSNCVNIDFALLTEKLQLKNGSLVTLQAEWIGSSGTGLFHCSDLILTTTAQVPSNVTCTQPFNSTSSSTNASPSASASASVSASASKSGAVKSHDSVVLMSIGFINVAVWFAGVAAF